jgi:hypothetical protein
MITYVFPSLTTLLEKKLEVHCLTSNNYSNFFLQATGKLGMLFKEQNARILNQINEVRQAQQLGMFTFVDKVMACLAENYTCCKAAGRRQCVLKSQTAPGTSARPATTQPVYNEKVTENMLRTPTAEKTAPLAPAQSDCDGTLGKTFSCFKFIFLRLHN